MNTHTAQQDREAVQLMARGEEGGALVIALLAVVFMTILGGVLMDVLRGGLVQAVSTEGGIQAETIAQKGLDDTIALLRGAVAKGESLGNTYRARIDFVESKLSEAAVFIDPSAGDGSRDNNGQLVEAYGGSYRIDLIEDHVKMNPQREGAIKPVTSPDFPYVRKFVIKSRGMVEGKPDKTVTKQMTVYVSTINSVFRYPVSSGRDMTLNGTPYIIGDILVRGGSLHVGDEAFFIGAAGSRYGLATALPAIRGFIRVDGDGMPGGTQKYNLIETDGTYGATDIMDTSYFANEYFPLEDDSLGDGPVVPAVSYVTDKVVTELNTRLAGVFGNRISDPSLFDYKLSANPGRSMLYDGQWVMMQGKFEMSSGAADVDQFVNNGVLMVADQPDHSPSELTIKRGNLYVKTPDTNLVAADLRGILQLDPDKYVAVDGNVTLNSGFYFPSGTMYVKGDLKLIGDIKMEGTVYVDGNVELKEMKSINKNAATPLIIVASGEIVLGNNTTQVNEEVRAFLYSQKNMRLYGVMSKLNLFGGIHGETGVELNAARGDLVDTGLTPIAYAGPAWSGKAVPIGQSGLAVDQSRLQITYDNTLYDNPPSGIPITDEFSLFVKDIRYVK
jgi:hypothetical protein